MLRGPLRRRGRLRAAAMRPSSASDFRLLDFAFSVRCFCLGMVQAPKAAQVEC